MVKSYFLTLNCLKLETVLFLTFDCQLETNGRLLYVIVKDGMEIFTSRCHIAAIHNTESFDNVTKVR